MQTFDQLKDLRLFKVTVVTKNLPDFVFIFSDYQFYFSASNYL